MALSGSTNYLTTRDDIIKRALRIIGALGQGETPQTTAVTEAAQALNDVFKEWQSDGLHMWKYVDYEGTIAASSAYVKIGVSQTWNINTPNKITSVYRRTGTGTSILDVPLIPCTKQEWDALPNKSQEGTPTHWYYRAYDGTASAPVPGQVGQLYVWPIPNSTFVTTNNGKFYITYMEPMDDFDSAGDNPDVPQWLYNALVWNLADQLAYEYGVPIAERAQIAKKAQYHKSVAMNFDQEEGSLFLQPAPNWGE